MTATSAASTLGDTWNRLPDCSKTLDPQSMPVGLRFSPPSLATLDLPQGRVLIAVDDAVTALDLQRLLHEAGYRVVGPATTVVDIQRRLARGDIDCVILDLEVDRRAPLPIADLLTFADVPFIYLSTSPMGFPPSRHRDRPVVRRPFTRLDLLTTLEKAMTRRREIANDDRWPAGATVVPWTRVYPPL
jgi:CheY-like chemotaxis protein